MAPLSDPSTWPEEDPHHQFANDQIRAHAQLMETAHQLVSKALPADEGWVVQISAQEVGQQAALLITLPASMQRPEPLTLRGGLRLGTQATGGWQLVQLDKATSVVQLAREMLQQRAPGGSSGGAGGSSDVACPLAKAALAGLALAEAALQPAALLQEGLAQLTQGEQRVLDYLLAALAPGGGAAVAGSSEQADSSEQVGARGGGKGGKSFGWASMHVQAWLSAVPR